ncbi:MAG: 30S ribosome-binding factor RbfA [Bacilli bacterium]|nr:30S ribosome-binding factor RbfA [Bacilli bacterium]MDD3304541.1 30S ribosome-binding factor RbfA [Bacilli bacterium]MDD4053843.1 30S ribosome-binding factor RbfA [Bacilli bacterium]MDD4411290.1 30S ribosome-binding factor RbfA [Bacilli bacterium]
MNTIRVKRIASSLQKEISDIIANEIRDEDLKLVTVTHIKLANDLGYAKVYVTTIFDDKKEKIIEDLNKASGFIKGELGRRKFEIRTMPNLEFVYDESLEYAHNIEKIIKDLQDEK